MVGSIWYEKYNSRKDVWSSMYIEFASYDLPEEAVTDNRLQFISTIFKTFLKKNGVKQTLSTTVSLSFKRGSRKVSPNSETNFGETSLQKRNISSMSHCLANFLFAYRNTPHTIIEVTLASLFLKRLPWTQLLLLFPNLAETVKNQQIQQKKYPNI